MGDFLYTWFSKAFFVDVILFHYYFYFTWNLNVLLSQKLTQRWREEFEWWSTLTSDSNVHTTDPWKITEKTPGTHICEPSIIHNLVICFTHTWATIFQTLTDTLKSNLTASAEPLVSTSTETKRETKPWTRGSSEAHSLPLSACRPPSWTFFCYSTSMQEGLSTAAGGQLKSSITCSCFSATPFYYILNHTSSKLCVKPVLCVFNSTT